MKMGAWSPLAVDRVRYVGDAVVIVVAETKGQARDAAEAVEISYKERPAVIDAVAALKPGAPQLHPEADNNLIFDWALGDAAATDAAIAKAAHVTKMHIVNNRLVPNAIEPRAALGHYDKAEDHYTCWTTSQNPHLARLVMSAFYNVAPENKLRVIAPDVGGAFGSKIYIYPEEIVCLWASKKTGVPVKWVADRTESFLTDAHGRDHVTRSADGLRQGQQDHRAQGRHHRQSRRLHVAVLVLRADLPLCDAAVGPVRHPGDLRQCAHGLYQHRAGRRLSRRRAAGGHLSWSSARSRRRRASSASRRRSCAARTSSRSFPHQTPVIMNYDAGDYAASLDAAMKAADYAGFPARKAAAAKRGKLRGIGMSCYIEACGIAPSAAVGSLGAGVGLWESAEVRVNAVGTIEVLTGSHSHGQGHETTFAQLVNQRFGVPIDSVSIVHGDTDKVQMGMGTYGSRSGAVGMWAIAKALDKVEAKAKKIAAHLMEADEGDIVIEDGDAEGRRHRQEGAVVPDGARRLYRAQSAGRHGAGAEGDVVLRSVQLHLPGRLLHLRGRDRSRHRPYRHHPVRGRRRFRQHHQSDDRRGAGAWRHRARHRPGAARRRPLRCRTAS